MTTLNTYPTARNDASEATYSMFGSQAAPNGVVWPTKGQGFLAAYGDSTGMQVKINAGWVLIDGFIGVSPSLLTFAIGAADSTRSRYDTLVARLDKSSSPWTISIIVVQGTVGGTYPALVNTTTTVDIPLAGIAINPGVTTIRAIDVGTQRQWTGSTPWGDCVPTWGPSPGASFTVSAANNFGRYRILNGSCEFAVSAAVALAGSNPGSVIFSLPQVPARVGWPFYVGAAMNTVARAQTTQYSAGNPIYGVIDLASGANFQTDGVARTVIVGGNYEIAG